MVLGAHDSSDGRSAPQGAPASVLGKVMLVLHAFDVDDNRLRLSDLRRRTGLAQTTLHRLVTDLLAAHLLDRDGNGYRLSRHLFELGMRATVERSLTEVSIPFMQDLYAITHETVHLGVREGAEVVYIAKLGGHRQADTPARIGGRLPLHCTAIGKALLAFAPPDEIDSYVSGTLARRAPRTVVAPGLLLHALHDTRRHGLAFEYEESAIGIACVATTIQDQQGEHAAALSVAGPVIRFDPRRHVNALLAASAGIQAALVRRSDFRPG